MIDVYFELKKEMGVSIGAVSLLEVDKDTNLKIWRTYKVYPITEKTVLFRRKENEFAVTNGFYKHEMGEISIEYINGYMNVNIREKRG